MKRFMIFAPKFGFTSVYENGQEGQSGEQNNNQQGAGAAGTGLAGTQTVGTTQQQQEKEKVVQGDPNDPLVKLKFNDEQQKFFNAKLAEEKRKAETQNQKVIGELTKLQQAQGTTEQQKKELQERINELQRQYMSKEELQKQQVEQQQKEFQQTLHGERAEKERWQKMYHESTITRALQDGAIEFEAYNPQQIIDLLAPKTKLVQEMDEQGQPTERYIPRVHIQEADNEGKLTTYDLSVKEVLQKMKGSPDRFGNLFKSTLAGGLGQNGSSNGTGRGKKQDPAKMTPEEWAKKRKEDPNFTFLNR